MSRAGLILSGILAAIFSLPVDAELSSIALRLERTLVAQTSGEIGTLAEAKEAIDAKQFERAQALLEPIVAGRPNDEEARFLLARVLSWREQFAASLAQYDVLLGRSPGNADYLLGKAQVLYWSGRSADALPVITEARRLAPDYAAVWRLEIGVLAALGGEENLARARRLRQQAVARFPDQEFDPVVSDTGPGLRRNEIELAGSYDHLSDGRDAWRGISLRLSHDFSRRENVYAVVRGTDRFDQTDQELQIGGYLALADKWTFNYEATFSPSHEVLPHWSVYGNLIWELSHGWNLQAGVRHRRYTRIGTDTISLALERYWSNYRAGYVISGTHLEGASVAFTHTLQFDYFYGDRSNIGGFAYRGEEVESVNRDLLLVRDTEGFGLRGVHWFKPDWGVTWLVEQQRIEDAFTRRGTFVGLRHRF